VTPPLASDSKIRVTSSSALWASAFVLLGLVLFKADQGAGAAASAEEMVVASGDYTLLTTAGRASEEIVVVIDNRNESLIVYNINRRTGLEPAARLDLAKTFQDAKKWAGRK